MKNLIYKISEIIDRKPFHLFAAILILLNLSGIGDPNYLTLLSVAGSILSVLLSLLLKLLFRRVRPEHNKYRIIKYGFPSGHSHVIFTIATIYSYYTPHLTIPFFLLASFVAASRIKIKAHDYKDALVGSILGIMTGLFAVLFFPQFYSSFLL